MPLQIPFLKPQKLSRRRVGNIAVREGIIKNLLFPNAEKRGKIQFEFLARKGS